MNRHNHLRCDVRRGMLRRRHPLVRKSGRLLQLVCCLFYRVQSTYFIFWPPETRVPSTRAFLVADLMYAAGDSARNKGKKSFPYAESGDTAVLDASFYKESLQ